jgi:hypothetical protein
MRYFYVVDKMFRGSPKIVPLSKDAQKKASPKAAKSKKCGGSNVKFI